jgi:hypothetical protein
MICCDKKENVMSLPPTWSFSVELDNYYVNSLTPLSESDPLFVISSAQGVTLYTIYGTGCTKTETDKYYHSSLKAQLYSDQGVVDADVQVFAPLTAFLTKVDAKLMKPLSPKDYWTFKQYTALYVNAASVIPMKQDGAIPLAQVSVIPTLTFGFDDPSLLEPFYHHFDPVRILDLNYWKRSTPSKAMFDRDPYSGRSKALFRVMMESLGMTDDWADFFSVLEFARLSLGFAMAREINQEDTNIRGNEAYMRLLSHTTFRGMFQTSIPPVFLQTEYTYRDPYVVEREALKTVNPFKELVRYVQLCFTEPFQKRIPFWHLCTTALLGGKAYISNVPSGGNPDLAQYYRDKANVENILASMVLKDWDTQGYGDELKKGVTALFGKNPPQDVIATMNMMMDNMNTYDLMSPVPFALPPCPMGYATRYGVAGTPRFLVEVTYAKTFYEQTAGGTNDGADGRGEPVPVQCVYDDAFRDWCVGECNLARTGWIGLQEEDR